MKKILTIVALLCASVMSYADWTGQVTGSATNVWLDGINTADTRTTVNYTVNYEIAYSENTMTVTIGFTDDNFDKTVGLVPQIFVNDGYKANFSNNQWSTTEYSAGTKLDMYIYFAYNGGANGSSHFSYTIPDGGGSGEEESEPDPTPVTQYCRLATGHLGEADFGDVNGRILLTLRKLSNSSVKVKVEPNNNGNDYFDVMHVELNGVAKELGTAGGAALTNMEFVYTGLSSLNFPLNILWHNHNWADLNGRWTTQQFSVTEAELCSETTELSLGSEYCCYYGDETKSGSHYAALTWETNEDGDVVITIGEGPGEHNTIFRGNGLGNDLSGFSVLSGEGFATDEAASDYFNRVYTTGGKTYILQKKGGVTLPSPAKIRFYGKPFEWACTENNNAYTENKTFVYTYGTFCSQLDAPTNVAIDGTNHITFDAVSGADSYTAYVSLGGVQKYTQVVASGDELTFVPLVTGDYTVNVVASGAGKVDSDPSSDIIWHLEAAPIELGNSEYCEHIMQTGTNTEAAFTWETDGSGNIVITITETLGGAADASHFRGNALALGNFKVGAGQVAGSNYFSHPGTTTGNQLVLTATTAPAPGEKIYYHGTVEYATSLDGNAWPTLDFEWTYGTVCAGKAVSATPNNSTMGTAVVKKGDDVVTNVEDGDEVTFIATVADAELYRFVNWTKGGVEVSTSATYAMTITETTNLVANFDYVRNEYCHYELLATGGAAVGKKLYMTLGSIGGGKYQIKYEGSAEAPLLGLNNANYVVNGVSTDIAYEDQKMSGDDVPFSKQNGRWIFDASGYGSAKMEFSLAEGRTINDIYVWENNIYFNTSYGELAYYDNNERLGLFGMNAAHRHNIDWEATCIDPVAPVIDKAEAEVLNESSVRLKIQATDNWGGLLTYTIARAGADDIVSNHASGEEFTQDVDGLTAGTEYTFTVTVSDGVNNANQNIVVTPVGDEEKPVMGEASLESKTWNKAVINVAATDNKGVTAYYVVEKDADYVAAEGKITVEGLTAATAYTFHIKAKDGAGNVSDNSAVVNFTTDAHLSAPATAAPVPTWPAEQVKSIYSDTYDFAPASLNSYIECWWDCPTMTEEAISENHYLHYDLYRNGMIGAQFAETSMSLMEKIHIDVWASVAGSIKFRPITNDGPNTPKILNLAAQQWNSFDIALSEFVGHDWSKVFQFAIEGYQDGGLVGEHISVDNIFFYRTTPPPADESAPTNVTANVIETSFTSVKISAQADDDSGIVHFKVMNGSAELVSDVEAVSGVATTLTVSGLTPNTSYSLKVIAFDEAGHEAAPVIAAATTQTLPPAAPQPSAGGLTVLSVYCDAFEPAVAASFRKNNWGSASVALEADYLLYTMTANVIVWGNNDGNAGYGNIDGLSGHTYEAKPGLDVSEMKYLHFDVWCDAADQLNTVNINDVAVTIPTTRTIAGEWVSFDVDITGVALADRQNVRWMKFHPFNATNCNVAIDNVYFWSYGVQSNVDSWATFASSESVKVPDDVTVYSAVYSKNGNEEVLTLTDAGKVIPAGTGVLLKGENNNTAYAFAVATSDDLATVGDKFDDNCLVGCTVRTDVSAEREENDIFCLRRSELFEQTAFFLYEGQYIPAGKAYLKLPKNVEGPSGASRRVSFVFDTVTTVDELNADASKVTKFIENGQLFIRRGDAVYTVQGTRVK